MRVNGLGALTSGMYWLYSILRPCISFILVYYQDHHHHWYRRIKNKCAEWQTGSEEDWTDLVSRSDWWLNPPFWQHRKSRVTALHDNGCQSTNSTSLTATLHSYTPTDIHLQTCWYTWCEVGKRELRNHPTPLKPSKFQCYMLKKKKVLSTLAFCNK